MPNFSETPLNPTKYKNKRNEMWGLLHEWLIDEHLPPDIPDDDEIQADFCASPYDRDAHDRKNLKPKKQIRKNFGFSPDLGDAAALTFAYPVETARRNCRASMPEPIRPMGIGAIRRQPSKFLR